MSDLIPIRDGVIPAFDLEREMVDYCQTQIRRFVEGAGNPPSRIAIALMGKNAEGDFHTRVNSWDERKEVTRMENCSMASALFLQRALADD